MNHTAAATSAEAVYGRLNRVRLVPVIRVKDSDTALELVDRLLAARLDVLEVLERLGAARFGLHGGPERAGMRIA